MVILLSHCCKLLCKNCRAPQLTFSQELEDLWDDAYKDGHQYGWACFLYLVCPGLVTVHIYDRWRENLLLQEFAFGFMMLALQVYLVSFNLQFHLWHN